MKAGAYDFIEKPFKPDRLIDMIHSAFSQKKSQSTSEVHQQNLDSAEGLATEIIGISPSIQTLRAHVTALANVNADVVIHGETGTGKELVAKCLHNLSVRNNKPFIPINVSAIPENLIESELFGYEAGSFTGASKAHMGKFEFADGGTLLLDEIESMPMYFQVKLLRVLQEREVVRIGSHKAKRINVRLIAATKKNLKHAAEAGEFREDLYYRLLVSEIRIPPLRERKEDISLLFHHFLNEASKQNQLEAPVVTTQDEMVLNMHNWPGNVRELKNTAERYLLTHSMNGIKLKELIQVSDQSDSLLNAEGSLNERLELVEKMVLEAELRHHQGNIKAVMEVLNLPRRTLNQKMAKYGIKREAFQRKTL
jgi:two-component system C4-dicarboxylate transport response regulator DctD